MNFDCESEWNEITETLASVTDKDFMKDLMLVLLTAGEREELSKRWALVKQLYQGRSQRAIANDLGLSLCKITRGSKELKRENSAFVRIFRMKENQNG